MTPAFDRRRLVELFGDDPVTLAELEREFVEDARRAQREILGSTDCAAVAAAAHRLKGSSGVVGAVELRQLAETVERAARAHDLAAIDRVATALAQEVRRASEQAGMAA